MIPATYKRLTINCQTGMADGNVRDVAYSIHWEVQRLWQCYFKRTCIATVCSSRINDDFFERQTFHFNNDDFSPAATEAENSHQQLGLLQRLLLLLPGLMKPGLEQQFGQAVSLLDPMNERSDQYHAKTPFRDGVHDSRSFCVGCHD